MPCRRRCPTSLARRAYRQRTFGKDAAGKLTEAGSLETGKSADFIVMDRDVLRMADQGNADEVADTQVLETWFQGKIVYVRAANEP
jgi:predicted amidohydrolase YtcJ